MKRASASFVIKKRKRYPSTPRTSSRMIISRKRHHASLVLSLLFLVCWTSDAIATTTTTSLARLNIAPGTDQSPQSNSNNTDARMTRTSTGSSGRGSSGSSSISSMHNNNSPPNETAVEMVVLAQLVPEEDESMFADRVQQQVAHRLEVEIMQRLESERNRQITVNAVVMDESLGSLDPESLARTSTSNNDNNHYHYCKYFVHHGSCFKMAVVGLLLIMSVALAVVLPTRNNSNSGNGGEMTTESATTAAPTFLPTTVAFDQLMTLIGKNIEKDGRSKLTDPTSSQYRALDWLANIDGWNAIEQVSSHGVPIQVLVERYALAHWFIMSTKDGDGGSRWTNEYTFLSNTSVCDWMHPDTGTGVICDGNNTFVEQLSLRKYINCWEQYLLSTTWRND